MTTYAAITDAETNPDAPITSSMLKRFRDNPLAIAEGDATAPKVSAKAFAVTSVETDWVMARIAAAAVGVIGSYIFSKVLTSQALTYGGLISGSSLRISAFNISVNSDFSANYMLGNGPALSGTWQCCGYYEGNGQAGSTINLWKRVA
jgi:hypothetical protein